MAKSAGPTLELDLGDLYRAHYPMVLRRVRQLAPAGGEIEATAHAVLREVMARAHQFRSEPSKARWLSALCAEQLGRAASAERLSVDGHLSALGAACVLYEGEAAGVAHVTSCEACAGVIAAMRAEDEALMIPLPEQAPKRTRSRSQITGTLAFVCVVAVLFLAVRSQAEVFVGKVVGPEPELSVRLGERLLTSGDVLRSDEAQALELRLVKDGFAMVVGVRAGEPQVLWPEGAAAIAVRAGAVRVPGVIDGGHEGLVVVWCERAFTLREVGSGQVAAPGCSLVRVELRR